MSGIEVGTQDASPHRGVDRDLIRVVRRRNGVARAVRAVVRPRLVGVLEVAELEVELAVMVLRVQRINDRRLPARRAAVRTAHVGEGPSAVERGPALVVLPLGLRRLDEHGRVEAELLVRGRAEVVVREDDPETPVLAVPVDDGIRQPALHRRPGAHPPADRLPGVQRVLEERTGAEERMLLRLKGAVAVEPVDRGDPLPDLVRAHRPVLVVPPVGRAVRRRHVELHQVDVLPDDVGGRGDLEVVHLVLARHQVRVPVLRAVERVQADDERLGRTRAGQGGRHVAPEGEDPLLGVMPPHLVELHVELDDGRLVLPRRHRVERLPRHRVQGRGVRKSTSRRAPRKNGVGFTAGSSRLPLSSTHGSANGAPWIPPVRPLPLVRYCAGVPSGA